MIDYLLIFSLALNKNFISAPYFTSALFVSLLLSAPSLADSFKSPRALNNHFFTFEKKNSFRPLKKRPKACANNYLLFDEIPIFWVEIALTRKNMIKNERFATNFSLHMRLS